MISVLGGGPAGCAAAIACRRAGLRVSVVERSRFPRHKVCGEFLSPEIEPLLRELGVWEQFAEAKPRRYTRLGLYFGKASKIAMLSEPAFGLSRYCFDRILLDAAIAAGARVASAPDASPAATVLAQGRRSSAPRGGRLFGFKAHFAGPAADSIELYFFSGCYVGVNSIEDGITNVCGIASEEILQSHDFEPDGLMANFAPLADRVRPLSRSWRWLITGPLVFGPSLRDRPPLATEYPVGDSLSFVDPFTGSGLISAVLTGSLVAEALVTGEPAAGHISRCMRVLRRPLGVAGAIRWSIRCGIAERMVGLVPPGWLMSWTRPRMR